MRTNSAGFVGRTGTVTEAAINSTQTHVSRTTPRTLTFTWGDTTSTSMFACALTLAIQLTCATYVQSQQANAATELVAQIHSHSLVVDAAKALIESRRALRPLGGRYGGAGRAARATSERFIYTRSTSAAPSRAASGEQRCLRDYTRGCLLTQLESLIK
jgi:hypothetical protein